MSSAPVRGIVPHRLRRHHQHHHHQHHQHHQHQHDKCKRRNDRDWQSGDDNGHASEQLPARSNLDNVLDSDQTETAESRPKVNPIFLWAAQREQRIVEVRCEDYDKRNRIKLTKTAQGWRSIPRTVLTAYSAAESPTEESRDKQTTSPTISQHEEKENSSSKVSVMQHFKKDEFDNAQTSYSNRLSEMMDIGDKGKRKRRKHGSCSKNKKRKTDLEQEDDRDEILVTSSWKMKKRKKYEKSKRRKKMRLDKEDEDSTNNAKGPIIKEESDNHVTSETHNICETTDSEDSVLVVGKVFKHCVDSSDKSTASIDDDGKRSDFEVIKKSRHFQPRVVLEQLHFPLLPTHKISRIVKKKGFQVNVGENKNINKMTFNGIASNNRHPDKEPPVDADVEETIINNDDLQEILNKLDANHIPIAIDNTTFNLMESNELPRNCTKLGVAILAADKINGNSNKTFEECNTRRSISTASERQDKFKGKSRARPGSRSLDETIERLEKSISSQNRLNSLPDVSSISVSNVESKVSPQIEVQLHGKSNLQNVTTTGCSTSSSPRHEDAGNKFAQDIIGNSKSFDLLKDKPEITVSLIEQEKHEIVVKNAIPVSILPDSQTETNDNEGSQSNSVKSASSNSKSRVDSPESTVNFSKHEDLCDTRTSEMNEIEYCKVRLTKNDESQSDHENYTNNNNDDDNNKNLILDENGRETCVNVASRDKVIGSIKTAIQTSPLNPNKCSEAQAKLLVLPKYQTNEKFDNQGANEFCSQVSPQPSGLPVSMSPLRRSSSVYLERLLPSPPCSVSCSDDAKTDLSLTSILSISNEDLKNAGAKEAEGDFDIVNETEVNSVYDVSIKIEKDIRSVQDHRKRSLLPEYTQKLTVNKQESRIMCEELGESNSVASDCVFLKRPQSADRNIDRKRPRNNNDSCSIAPYTDQTDLIKKSTFNELEINPVVFLDPASQLRELLRTSGHLIPDPLLVPRDYLPLIASAPLAEIPNLLATRPELRLPEALTRPELLTDPDLLVISLEHLQHVLDHGEASLSKPYQVHQPILSSTDDSKDDIVKDQSIDDKYRPKLSCKPIGKLMPAPMDLSNNQKSKPKQPLLRVRSGLLKQEPEVSSTANSPDDLQLWHPLFGSQKQRQQQQQQAQDQKPHQASWHRTTLTS